jgi:glycosyltransferase involved in cell wall biosynthesis
MSRLVSVIIPVFNAAQYMGDCLQSICRQTYANLEIIVVDDASTDGSGALAQSLNDKRIRVIQQTQNRGLAESVNTAIRLARGAFIARMDADDIALPTRIEKQVRFLEANPEVDIVGAAMRSFGHGHYTHRFPAGHDACKARLLFNVCFGHPTVLMRKRLFDSEENFYRPELRQYSEEYELWCRLADRHRFANLQEVLLLYRTFADDHKREASHKRRSNSFHIRKKFLQDQLGVASDEVFLAHDHLANLDAAASLSELTGWVLWLHEIEARNKITQSFAPVALKAELAGRQFEIHYANAHLGLPNFWVWQSRKKKSAFDPGLLQQAKFLYRSIFG